ncbi:UDP-glucose:protein N-beta-glucosyltransferase [Planctomycetales bacterium 10988]|nr:UDP-glucose:protein N-beta-glucosyltransferase [Planctomycetales bacterium 10988]
MADLETLYKQASQAFDTGQFPQAEQACRQVTKEAPQFAPAWRLLGLCLQRQNRLSEALTCHQKAVEYAPKSAEAHNDLGINYAQLGQLAMAGQHFSQAVKESPDHVNAWMNLGSAFLQQNEPVKAESAFRHTICLSPESAEGHFRLGSMLQQQQRIVEAVVSLQHAIKYRPNLLEAHRSLGKIFEAVGQIPKAIEAWEKISQLDPQDLNNWIDLGNAMRRQEKQDKAEHCYKSALQVNPQFAPAAANLANIRAEQGNFEEARNLYLTAHRSQGNPRLRVIADKVLPVIYDSEDQILPTRKAFTERLDKLVADRVMLDPTQEIFPTHFYLAYHGMNDRELHEKCAKVALPPEARKWQPPKNFRKKGPGEKIRLGFFSRHLKNHTIGQLNVRLIEEIDRKQFEVIVISVTEGHGAPDITTQRIAKYADQYIQVPADLLTAIKKVAECQLDILYLPDIGMDALTYTAAFNRMAPIQACCWGHPVTTGLKTVDAFVSSVHLDPPGAGTEDQYTERIIRLPRLGVVYEKPQLEEPIQSRSALGVPEEGNLYVCPQTLFKFHPEMDDIFAGVLRGDPNGHLALIKGKYDTWESRLEARWAKKLPDVRDRIHWVKQLPRIHFLHLLHHADVMLDPLHFGGGNTSYEGFAFGTPIVTLPNHLLRGRLTYSMYQQMDWEELIVDSNQEYIDKAVRLGTDPAYRKHCSDEINKRSPVLYNDTAIVRDWEKALLEMYQERMSS